MARKKTTPLPKKKKTLFVGSTTPAKQENHENPTLLNITESLAARLADSIPPDMDLHGLIDMVSKMAALSEKPFEIESSADYATSKDKNQPPAVLEFDDHLYCTDRIKDIFLHKDFEVTDINDFDFLIERVDCGKVFVRVNSEMPIIRLLVPVFFQKKLSRSKRQAWCCAIMSEFPSIRICADDLDECVDVFMCLDYDYGIILHTGQLIYAVVSLSTISEVIYMEFSEILDTEIFGMNPSE